MTLNFLLRFIKTHSNTSRMGTKPSGTNEPEVTSLGRSESQASEDSSCLETSFKNPGTGFISSSEITYHIHSLREYLPKGNTLISDPKRKGEEEGAEFDHLLHVMVRKESWDHASTETVIQRSLVTGNVPLGQSYLIHRL
ncbi:PREDICTED: uncharacterized protein LOC109593589 [Amphimedon queenslandica]|uniref:Uncharacterized protein n=1 Tax=Amphimedon queenslandica TaxID=400682 RepID=A0A1X7SE47_AMPQE|nr:PREDICTED: uncharacterized protein LOC109593589 [Amphimedon queenslandica]|eukprot:XP_019864164.1 PREDICTED: uncharacterized protein LOC109593589 [Amphimedon queenslandica]